MCRTRPGHLCFLPLSPGSSSAVAPRDSRGPCEASRQLTFIPINDHASSTQTPTLHLLTTVNNKLNTTPQFCCYLQLILLQAIFSEVAITWGKRGNYLARFSFTNESLRMTKVESRNFINGDTAWKSLEHKKSLMFTFL